MPKHSHHLSRIVHATKSIHHKIKKASRRKLTFIFLGAVINLILLAQIYSNIWVYPQTHLGTIPVSGKRKADIEKLLKTYQKNSYSVRVRNRSYTYALRDLGVAIDIPHVEELVFAPNHKPFPLNILELAYSFVHERTIPIPLSFTQKYTAFIDGSVFDFSEATDDVLVSDQEKSVVYVENEEKYRFDEAYFRSLIQSRLDDTKTPLYPRLVKVENAKAATIADVNDRIKQMVLSPLTVFIDPADPSKTFILTEKELASIAEIQLTADQTSVTIAIHKDILTQLMNDHAKKIRLIGRGNIVTPKIIESMQSVLNERFNGHTVDALTLEIDKGPNTTGGYAKKYIEVDISQQKMYLFKNDTLTKEYRVSTGKDYPTPVGEFAILNKTGLGYSTIYNVWMPWWMGFAYSNELHAYFGIHELPYAVVGGNKIQRPTEFIGTPNTGGCIALDVGAAREVYAFADVGTPVVIYQ